MGENTIKSLLRTDNNAEPQKIGFLLLNEFSMIAFASAIEPLRAANRQSNQTLFDWVVASTDGNASTASNGMTVQTATETEELQNCRPGIAKISLTGGVETGRLIMAQSAQSLKKITLELGGKSPLLVFEDCDFDLAVQTALDANFYTGGEVCSNATRVFVQRSIADDFIAAMTARTEAMRVGDPMASDIQMGALISSRHLAKVLDYVKIGVDEGATIATGGNALQPQGFENGYFMQPTILTNCHDDMRVVREEIFGPVMSVLIFDDEDEAIRRANSTNFGLGAGVMTQDLARAHRVADALESGNVWVNSYNLLPPGLPFGGAKHSGFGRENSAYTLDAYSEIKSVYIQL